MNIILWVIQGLLAAIFLMAGFMKASKSREELIEEGGGRMDWVEDLSDGNIKLIGILEVLGAVGLILPLLTGILTWLIPFAAIGLVLDMLSAAIFHARRGDGQQAIVPNVILLLLAAYVVFGRFATIPFI